MTTVSLVCFICNKQYAFPLKFYNLKKKRSPNAHDFCSHTCHNISRKLSIDIACDTCKTIFNKLRSQITKTKHNFCSKSCAAIYRNKNKTIGIRRSKLELFLETKILETFPDIKCIFNDRTAIGTELDIYFTDLKLAIQIDGITHYQPIYGISKFQKIKTSDVEKRKLCLENGIKLIEIDVSGDKHFKYTKDSRWNKLKSIINSYGCGY